MSKEMIYLKNEGLTINPDAIAYIKWKFNDYHLIYLITADSAPITVSEEEDKKELEKFFNVTKQSDSTLLKSVLKSDFY